MKLTPRGHLGLGEADLGTWCGVGQLAGGRWEGKGPEAPQVGGQRFEWDFRGATSQEPHAGTLSLTPFARIRETHR